MKQILGLFIALSVLTASFASGIAPSPASSKPAHLNASELFIPIGKDGKKISLLDFSQIRVKEYEKLSGQKMNFAEKIKFRVVQNQLAKSINNDNTLNLKKLNGLKHSKKSSDKRRQYSRTWLVLLILALVCALLALILPFFGILSLIFGIGFLLFFILWLIE